MDQLQDSKQFLIIVFVFCFRVVPVFKQTTWRIPQITKVNLVINNAFSILQPGKKYDCVVCKRDVGAYTLILVTNNYYCIPCFAKLKKWPATYNVINKLEFPVFQESWCALEEIYLFQGLQKHGFGNWGEIADYIQTNKTREDVEKHYTETYLNAPNFLPDQNRLISNKVLNGRTSKPKTQKNRQTLISKRIQTNNLQKAETKTTGVEIVGFMPLRKDFQFEYDNQAELLLAQMEFNDEDTPEEIQLKFKIIDLYNSRLTQRNKKKQFVFSRGILDLDKQIQVERTLPKAQKQIYNMMKIFSRFHTVGDHDELVKGIIREKQLRQKIQQYKQLRRRGFTTKAQIEQQIERKNQTKTKKKISGQYGFSLLAQETNRNNRRANHGNTEVYSKKPGIYFTNEEIQLLKSLKLSSISYMMVKQTILREYEKLGSIDRDQALSMFCLEKFIVNNIIDFLVDNGEIMCSN